MLQQLPELCLVWISTILIRIFQVLHRLLCHGQCLLKLFDLGLERVVLIEHVRQLRALRLYLELALAELRLQRRGIADMVGLCLAEEERMSWLIVELLGLEL